MFKDLPNYQSADPKLWQGRTDTTNNERFFQKINFINDQNDLITENKKTILLGFASDEGIIRNQGRPGAKLGPNEIKTQLAKLPSSMTEDLIDLGTIQCEGSDLESAQEQFGKLISLCHQYGHHTIGLGGGHEIAWAHYQGLSPHYNKLGIINFDAHFDLRPHKKGQLGTSGTPFSQIAAHCHEHNLPFEYCCIGIQKFGNTQSLVKRANELQVKFLTAQEVNELSLAAQISFLEEFIYPLDHIYLSICLDVLAECFAPGVSAPQTMGLTPWQIVPLLRYIIQSGKVVSIDIAELSPPLDQDKKTARLAALIIAELLHIN